MTTIKENRIVYEVTVPHSPVASLDIVYERFDLDYYRVWLRGHPEHWETGSSLAEAIGTLMFNLGDHGITVSHGSYQKAVAERRKRKTS